jgi:peptidoglycan/LPS O-acetylase OafA/YrhL
MPGRTPSASSGRIEGLDVLRGFAILLVLLRHAWPQTFGAAGIIGVVVFFALSGYLITGLLLRDISSGGRVRYGRFYRHRAIRLLPALIVVLAAFAVIEGIFDLNGDRDEVVRSLIVGITYTMNIPGFDHGSDLLGHLWTLATEEQFYLVWPLILVWGARKRRIGPAVFLAGVLIGAALVATLVWASPNYGMLYPWPTSWSLAMVIGAAAQVGTGRVSALLPPGSVRVRVAGSVALVVILLLAVLPERGGPWAYLVTGPVTALATVVLIAVVREWRATPARALRPLVWLGTVSYAAYLWNWPIVGWLEAAGAGDWTPLLSITLTLAAAAASWVVVERPANRLRVLLDARARPTERAETPDRIPLAVDD